MPAKGPINKTRSTQSLRLRDEPRHASVALAVWGQWPAHRGRQQQSTGAPAATPRCRWHTGSGNSRLPADTGWQLQAASATAHRPPGRAPAGSGRRAGHGLRIWPDCRLPSRLALARFRRFGPDALITKRPASIVRPGARLMIGGGRTVRARAFEWWSQRTSPSWTVGGCPRTMCLSCGSATTTVVVRRR